MIKIYNNNKFLNTLYSISYLNQYESIDLFISEQLNKYNLNQFYDYLISVPILEYNYKIIDDENIPIYAFLIYDGIKNDFLENKVIIDKNNTIIQNKFKIPLDPPVIIIGDSNKYYKYTSIVHEIFHLVYLMGMDDKLIDGILVNIPSLEVLDKEEYFSIKMEYEYLHYLEKDDKFIDQYISDRYLPGNKKEYHQSIKNDILSIIKY